MQHMKQPKKEQSDIWRARAEYCARMGGDPEDVQLFMDTAAVLRDLEHTAIREQRRPPRKLCGAKTRRGTACLRKGLKNGRCPNHGGCSTGPKTAEGRQRIAEAQRARWAKWRESRV